MASGADGGRGGDTGFRGLLDEFVVIGGLSVDRPYTGVLCFRWDRRRLGMNT